MAEIFVSSNDNQMDRWVGARLALMRRHRNVAPDDIAEAFGVNTETYRRWERGESALTVRRLHQIAVYLNTKTSWFVDEFPNELESGEDMPVISKMTGDSLEVIMAFNALSTERRGVVRKMIETLGGGEEEA